MQVQESGDTLQKGKNSVNYIQEKYHLISGV